MKPMKFGGGFPPRFMTCISNDCGIVKYLLQLFCTILSSIMNMPDRIVQNAPQP